MLNKTEKKDRVILWLNNAQGDYLFCNSMFNRFFHVTDQGLMGKVDSTLLSSELVAFLRDQEQIAIHQGHCSFTRSFTYGESESCLKATVFPIWDGELLQGFWGMGYALSKTDFLNDYLSLKEDDKKRVGRLFQTALKNGVLEPDSLDLINYTINQQVVECSLRMQIEMINATSDSVFLMTADSSQFIYVNQTAAKKLEYTVDELTGGMCVFDIDPELQGIELWHQHMSDLKLLGSRRFETLHRTQSGYCFPVEISATFSHQFGHDVVIAIARDISERKRCELVVVQREQELRALAEASPGVMGSFHLWPSGKVTIPYVSQSVFDVFGLDYLELFDDSKALAKLVHPDDLRRLLVSLSKSAKKLTEWYCDFRIIHPSKGVRCLEVYAKPQVHEQGGVIWYGHVHDVTERKTLEEGLQVSLELNERILDTLPDLLFEIDADGVYLNVWSKHDEQLVSKREELLGKNFRDVLPTDAVDVALKTLQEADEKGYSIGNQYRINLHNESRWFELYVTKNKINGHYAVLARDITQRFNAQRELEQALDFSQSVLSALPDILFELDEQGTYLNVWASDQALLAQQKEQLLGKRISEVLTEENAEICMEAIRLAKQYGRSVGKTIYVDLPMGRRWFELSVSIYKSYEGRFLGLSRDVTALIEAKKDIEHLAFHDPLIGLPNRIMAKQVAEQLIEEAKQSSHLFALVYFDLDEFKGVNDTFGHSVGDIALKKIAQRVQQGLSDNEILYRQGGDEFLILVKNAVSKAAIAEMSQTLLSCLEQPIEFMLEDSLYSLTFSASIGIALLGTDGNDYDILLKNADMAMYQAKRNGKNGYSFYSHELGRNLLEQFKISQDFKSGIANNEFVLHYQPQIDLVTNQITGVEALIRWNHPIHGFLMPARFISAAENTGMIVALGEWIIQEACQQVARWQHKGIYLSVAINISAPQFKRGNLESLVKNYITQAGIEPSSIELELTESLLMQDTELTMRTVANLKSFGVRIAIDDFGTGYSSLAYLKKFSVDKLKIDQSFIADILNDLDDEVIVKTIIQMAKNLNLQTIAEGVEEAKVADCLALLGCNQVQGYHYAKPMPAEQLEHYFTNY